MGEGRAEGLSAAADGGQAAISLTPDVGSTGSYSLLVSVLSTVLKKLPSDVWVVVPFLVTGDTAALDCI